MSKNKLGKMINAENAQKFIDAIKGQKIDIEKFKDNLNKKLELKSQIIKIKDGKEIKNINLEIISRPRYSE